MKLQWQFPTNWSAEDTTGKYYIETASGGGWNLYKNGRLIDNFRWMDSAMKVAEHPMRRAEMKRTEDPNRPEDECPRCGCGGCARDEVDVGVGIIYGPYGCPCGWSEHPDYDQEYGRGGWQEDGSYHDTQGGHWPAENTVTKLMRALEGYVSEDVVHVEET